MARASAASVAGRWPVTFKIICRALKGLAAYNKIVLCGPEWVRSLGGPCGGGLRRVATSDVAAVMSATVFECASFRVGTMV